MTKRWIIRDGIRRKVRVHTKGHLKALLKVDNPICGICMGPILHPETATVDHIFPISLGGTNYRSNVQLAHPKCNRKKANQLRGDKNNG